MDRTTIRLFEGEFRRYKALAEGAFRQLDPDQLGHGGEAAHENSVATLVWHISGNLSSRFTDFLESDGEKPWRDRESEFAPRSVGLPELEAKWAEGWEVLLGTLAALSDAELRESVTIRGVSLRVDEALLRSLAHTSYHVGQIVLLAKALRGAEWTYLSIAPGGSAAYNANPTSETSGAHARRLDSEE